MKELQIEITNHLHDNLCVKLNKDIINVFNLNHELHYKLWCDLWHDLNDDLDNDFGGELYVEIDVEINKIS